MEVASVTYILAFGTNHAGSWLWVRASEDCRIEGAIEIMGLSAVNPLTGSDTGLPARFVVSPCDLTADKPEQIKISPAIIPDGQHRNVSGIVADNALVRMV